MTCLRTILVAAAASPCDPSTDKTRGVSEDRPASGHAQVVVYGSWGHRDGSVYAATRSAYPDFPTMQRRTQEGCEAYVARLAARRARGRVSLAPVGDAFRRVYESEAMNVQQASRATALPPAADLRGCV